MPINKPIPDFVLHPLRKLRRYELTRTLHVPAIEDEALALCIPKNCFWSVG